MTRKVYVASSWRNTFYPEVVATSCQGSGTCHQYLPSYVLFGIWNDEVGCVGDAKWEL